ncbi:MAG: bis-aminopropyl spermidine synthase family protein [Acidimicrobiales bacterium]
MDSEVNLREALNAISDVIQNRPRPLRQFDQIYMKAADMVAQAEYVARWADGRRLAFLGDGDSISVCAAYLHAREILPYGPSQICVFDFDERMVNAIRRFADHAELSTLDASLYNCIDPLPEDREQFDCFYTNPPWGASNAGNSVNVFVQRGMELVRFVGEGLIVIADDPTVAWSAEVLANVQAFAAERGFYVNRLAPQLHSYHLDDAPDLKSCNLQIRSRPSSPERVESLSIDDPSRLDNFYGQGVQPKVRYVRERVAVDYGTAHEDEYELRLFEE